MSKANRTFIVGIFEVGFFGILAATSLLSIIDGTRDKWYNFIIAAGYIWGFCGGVDRINKFIL